MHLQCQWHGLSLGVDDYLYLASPTFLSQAKSGKVFALALYLIARYGEQE